MATTNENFDLAITRETGIGILAKPSLSGALNFARRRDSKYPGGVYAVVAGVPTTSRPGAWMGPHAEASTLIGRDWDHGCEFHPSENVSIVDSGNLLFSVGLNESISQEIEDQFRQIHSRNIKTPMFSRRQDKPSIKGRFFIILPARDLLLRSLTRARSPH